MRMCRCEQLLISCRTFQGDNKQRQLVQVAVEAAGIKLLPKLAGWGVEDWAAGAAGAVQQ
jgi:hypothetical protein